MMLAQISPAPFLATTVFGVADPATPVFTLNVTAALPLNVPLLVDKKLPAVNALATGTLVRFAEPSKLTPLIVLAFVNLSAVVARATVALLTRFAIVCQATTPDASEANKEEACDGPAYIDIHPAVAPVVAEKKVLSNCATPNVLALTPAELSIVVAGFSASLLCAIAAAEFTSASTMTPDLSCRLRLLPVLVRLISDVEELVTFTIWRVAFHIGLLVAVFMLKAPPNINKSVSATLVNVTSLNWLACLYMLDQ